MPYQTNAELPDAVKKLPEEKQTVWREAFNSAVYDQKLSEEEAAKIAWAAVEQGSHSMASMVSTVRASGDKGQSDVDVLFDTGATLSFVTRSVAAKLATITKMPKAYTIKVGDGGTLSVTDMAVLVFKAAGRTIMDTFLVLEESLHDIILGEATMRKFGLKIDLERSIIYSAMRTEEKPMKEFLHKLLLALAIEAADDITEDAAIALIKAKMAQPEPPKRPKTVVPASILEVLQLGEEATESEARGAIMALKFPADVVPRESYERLETTLQQRDIVDLIDRACRPGSGEMEGKLYPHEREWALGEATRDYAAMSECIKRRHHVLSIMGKLPGKKDDPLVIDELQAKINKQLEVSPEMFRKHNARAN